MYINFVAGLDIAILFNLDNSMGFEMSYPSKKIILGAKYTDKSNDKSCGVHLLGSNSRVFKPGKSGRQVTPSKNTYFLNNSSGQSNFVFLKTGEFSISWRFCSLFTVAYGNVMVLLLLLLATTGPIRMDSCRSNCMGNVPTIVIYVFFMAYGVFNHGKNPNANKYLQFCKNNYR